jgi:hypothetical protein
MPDDDGNTLLHVALTSEHLDLVQDLFPNLLLLPIDLFHANRAGQTIFDLAESVRRPSVGKNPSPPVQSVANGFLALRTRWETTSPPRTVQELADPKGTGLLPEPVDVIMQCYDGSKPPSKKRARDSNEDNVHAAPPKKGNSKKGK